MLADLDTLLTTRYCMADDLLPGKPNNARRRVTDPEVVTLCVAQAIMGIPEDPCFLGRAGTALGLNLHWTLGRYWTLGTFSKRFQSHRSGAPPPISAPSSRRDPTVVHSRPTGRFGGAAIGANDGGAKDRERSTECPGTS